MTWLIIIFAVLLIIAPAYALLPSDKQKRQMAMRREAMGVGIGVELTQIEDPDPDPEKYISSTGQPLELLKSVAAYRLSRPPEAGWRQPLRLNWSLVKTGIVNEDGQIGKDVPDGWQWQEDVKGEIGSEFKNFVYERIADLPGDVIRVDEKNLVISVYWNEINGHNVINGVIGFLQQSVKVPLRTPPMDDPPKG